MKSLVSSLNFLLAISTFLSPTSALPPANSWNQGPSRPTVTSTQVCGTGYGPRYGPFSTSRTTITSTIKSTTVATSSSTTTINPPPSTSTIVSTTTITSSVTASTPTSVSTSTVTSVVTQTAATDSTITNTSTNTFTNTVTPTSFIPTSAGFIPLDSSLPGAGLKKRDISQRVERRQIGRGGSQSSKPTNVANAWSSSGTTSVVGRYPTQGAPPGYPTAVQCTVTVYSTTVVTSTSTTKTTVTASTATVTTTSTASATTTSTIFPTTATSTTTATTIVTTVSTSTNIITATTTVSTTISTTASTTVTSYAACQTDNLAGSYQGQGLIGWGFSVAGYQPSLNTYDTDSAVGCCNLAASMGLAWFFNFYPNIPQGQGNCDIIVGNYCPVPTTTTVGTDGFTTMASATMFYAATAAPSSYQVSGNGPCGVVQNAVGT